MRVETRDVVVPEHKTYERVYIASDGKEFNSEEACERHEFLVWRDSSPIWQRRIENVYDFTGSERMTLFYVDSQDDYDFIIRAVESKNLSKYSDKFSEYGRGWYMYWWSNDGTSYGTDYIQKLDNYIATLSRDLDDWKMNVTMKISEKVFDTRCNIE